MKQKQQWATNLDLDKKSILLFLSAKTNAQRDLVIETSSQNFNLAEDQFRSFSLWFLEEAEDFLDQARANPKRTR